MTPRRPRRREPPNWHLLVVGAVLILVGEAFTGRSALAAIRLAFVGCPCLSLGDAISYINQLPDLQFLGVLAAGVILLGSPVAVGTAIWYLARNFRN